MPNAISRCWNANLIAGLAIDAGDVQEDRVECPNPGRATVTAIRVLYSEITRYEGGQAALSGWTVVT
jgi:hypothetical protein